MTIERAFRTHGFMDINELTYLAQMAEKSTFILEVGSWMGRSARALADNTDGIVYCVDTWADDAYGDAPAEMTGATEWLWNEFQKNHEDTIAAKKVIPIRMTSVEAARMFPHLMFDLIHIDAGHNYEDVKGDILAWRPHLYPFGILCGHDMYPEGPYHPGVLQAVKELVPNYRVVPSTTIWTTEGC